MRVITPPVGTPVTLDEARAQLRLDGSDEDALLEGYIAAATGHVEDVTCLLLMPQTVAFDLDCFADLRRPLPRGPIRSVTISYEDVDGSLQTVDPSTYRVRERGGLTLIRLAESERWPDLPVGGQVVVTAEAGFADAAAVPNTLRQAILFLAAHYFEHRTPVNVGNIVNELPMTFKHLVEPYRLWLI